MKQPHLTRRRFLALSGLTLAGTGFYTWRIEPHWIQVVERDLPIIGLPAALDGKTLVQLSDLHAGSVDPDYLASAMQRVSDLKPDLTVITGDFMTCHGNEAIDAAIEVVRHLRPGPLGCFAILGNHDYALNWRRPDVADQLAKRLAESDIRVMRNEFVNIAGLQLVGLDDLWATNFHPERVLPKVDWSQPALTLCHNPDAVDLPALASIRGWILAGHTHGGQCKPPFLPPPRLPVMNKRYTSGEFDVGNGRMLYINRGLGHLLRVRFNARPEITVFRLCTIADAARTRQS
ncbi:MAG: metallophosphoesterase [Gemmataceae bacterium]